ncbi:CKLF-like MARVEL transmembrane domain-containing protein 7 [Pristis pectinata]|uniref:CKLF-like MARVEL transmembrane domain-containing protein 7 n=1 Tax=Pristis pectinata TaxID=685728 RepID=UPI00223DEA79|nr:CKLF-like MARVEL transmembrane domain-containing protein 7 [Pristis pectinata]
MADMVTTGSRDSGFLDLNYARSFSGLLKILQAIVVFIAFLSIKCSEWTHHSTYRHFEVVTIWFFIVVLIFYIIYLTRLHLKITCIHWSLTEFLHYVIATILLLIASIVGATKADGYPGLAAGVFFGFASTILYGIGAWQAYKMWRVPQPATVTV